MNQLLIEAARVLNDGGIVGVPTDTVYGLAVDPESEEAVARLFELKRRPSDNPIALLAADTESAAKIVAITPEAKQMVTRHWPGALTVVLAPKLTLPAWVGDPVTRSVGVRVPDHALLRRLLWSTGPLAVTSANLAGKRPARSDRDAQEVFGDDIDLYIPGRSGGSRASTVVDMTGESPVIVREGALDPFS